MADYYGITDMSNVAQRSITETLIQKYKNAGLTAANPLKTDEIAKGYRTHVSLKERGKESIDQDEDEDKPQSGRTFSKEETKSGTSADASIPDDDGQGTGSGGLFGFIKSFISYKFTEFANAIYGPNESDFTEKERIENLFIQKKTATSYNAWVETCEKLDELQNFNDWKQQKESTLYDYKLIESNLKDLRDARLSGDVRKLLYLIRTTWTRNIGNIGNVNLYRHSHAGTKALIEEYLEECELALEAVTKENKNLGIDDRYIMSMLVQTRKNIGRTALVLSGGGCFGLFHIGVLAALLEEKVLPRIISGSSAGAIIASILCVHTNGEIVDLLESIVEKQFNIFGDSQTKGGFLVCLSRFLKYGTWYNNTGLRKTMIEFLGDLTFREAYNRSGKILNITVSPASVHEHPRLLNYLTAPSVLIWSAVCASCSLPGIFESSTIYEKNLKTGATQEWHHASVKFVDGSVDNDMPITRLSEMFNVDHIIACQVNPHVVPFLKLSVTCVGGEIETEYSAMFKTKLSQFYGMWAAEVTHYLQMCEEIGIARNICTKLRSVLSQQYSGDITILPDLKEISQLNKLLSNPTPQYLLHCTMKGARATWPKIALIRNHCGLEFALDNAIRLLRSRNFKNLNSTNLALINSPNLVSDASDGTTLEKSPVSLDTYVNQHYDNGIGVSSSVSAGAQNPLIRSHSSVTKSNMARHHNRHRSETLSVGKLRTLRSVQSNVSVNGDYNKTTNYKNYGNNPGRVHRSYSASTNDNINNLYNHGYTGPGSEATSPLKFNFKARTNTSGDESYFRPVYGMSPTKTYGTSGSRKNSAPSSSSSSENITKRKSYVNIDHLDGLFGPSKNTIDLDADDDEIDPIKVDDQVSQSSND